MTESQVVNEWILRGMIEARIIERREYLLLLVDGRFPGGLSDEMRDLLERTADPDLLRTWFHAAVQAYTFDHFLNVVKQ